MKKIYLLTSLTLFTISTQAQIIFNVESPSSIAGEYDFSPAGTDWTLAPDMTIPGNAILDTLMLVDDGTADDTLSCNPLINDLIIRRLSEDNIGRYLTVEILESERINDFDVVNRFIERQHKKMKCKAGSIIFFDSGLWHQVGKPSTNSRWSIFNMYGPWFMKPYFNFACGLKKNQIKKLNKVQRKILHFDSIPPKNSEGRIATFKPAKKVDYKKLYL